METASAASELDESGAAVGGDGLEALLAVDVPGRHEEEEEGEREEEEEEEEEEDELE